MGLFQGKKKIHVSSVVYNMAGPEEDRANYLKTTVIAKVLSVSRASMGEHVVSSYLRGPGIKLRNYVHWAYRPGVPGGNYAENVGMTPGDLNVGNSIDLDVLETQIPNPDGYDLQIQSAAIGVADYTWWADQWIMENRPEDLNTDYTTSFNYDTYVITILFEDLTTASFSPVGYDPNGMFLYVSYTPLIPGHEGEFTEGDLVLVPDGDDLPDTTGWDTISETITSIELSTVTVIETEVTYSDTTPGTSDTDTLAGTESYDSLEGVYERTTYMGEHPTEDALWSKQETMYQWQDGSVVTDDPPTVEIVEETLAGGVIKTTTTTTTTQSIKLERSYQINEQELIDQAWGPTSIYIYQKGTGNPTLDAMFAVPQAVGHFFPFIPIRVNNAFVSPTYISVLYPLVKKAFMKSVTGKFDKVVEDIKANPNLGDIDYAYAVFGVSLNTKESAALRYIYELFQEMMLGNSMGPGGYLDWQLSYEESYESQQAWVAWKNAQSNEFDPLYGTPAPEVIPYPDIPSYSLNVASGNYPNLNYNITMQWAGVEEHIGSGLKKPDAKNGEIWFEKVGMDSYPYYVYADGGSFEAYTRTVEHVRLNWQIDEDTWRSLDIWDLTHMNMIYGGNGVFTTAFQALDDPEESGFIVPLHDEIYRQLPLLVSTQMATACCYLVFNCFTIVKTKWYENDFVKVLIIIAAIALTIWIGGAGGGLAAAGGLLGTNAAIGAAIGFTGIAAAIAGAVANAIAAMILTQLITMASTAIFGKEVGMIVGVIASLAAVSIGSSLAMGGSLTTAFDQLMSVENLMKLTTATGNAYSSAMQANAQEQLTKMQSEMASYAEQAKQLEELYRKNIEGTPGEVQLDPLTLGNVGYEVAAESSETFLGRTLMTGSDVAEASHEMIGDFVELTTSTNLPGL